MTRRIAIVGFPGAQSLDIVGPLEVFAGADRAAGGARPAYRVELLAPGGEPILCSSGLTLVPDAGVRGRRGAIDTLVVAGGEGTRQAMSDPGLLRAIGSLARRSRRVTSVCTGAFLLGAAGLLDGRRATTHWRWCDLLARQFPRTRVEPDRIFVRDGELWTSAGVTAGMDLALALVEADLGRDLALEVARHLVVFVRRSGGQSQFSAQLAAQVAERDPLRDLQTWIQEHPDATLSVPSLAARAGMSPRNFARVFRREVGVTPAAYVEQVRVELARRLLETGGGFDRRGRRGRRLRHRRVAASRLRPPRAPEPARVPQPFPPGAGRRFSPTRRQPMSASIDIVFLLFPHVTPLDAVGPYEVLSRLPGARVRLAAPTAGPLPAEEGALALVADSCIDDVSRADVLVVPGGWGSRAVATDARVLAWVQRIDTTTQWTCSVCTGALILGAAGLLDGSTRDHALGVAGRAAPARCHPVDRARGHRWQVHDGRRCVGWDRSRADADSAHCGRSDRAGDPTRARVRPATSVHERDARDRATDDREPGAGRPGVASPDYLTHCNIRL